jgi:hypothetical protein
VIQAGGRTIQILPKIDRDPGADAEAIVDSASYERATVSATQIFALINSCAPVKNV